MVTRRENDAMRCSLLKLFAVFCSCYSTRLAASGCMPPRQITGGFYEPVEESYNYGDQINYTCQIGYHRASGPKTRTCHGIAKVNALFWSGEDPNCAPIDCGDPDIPDAQYNYPESTTFEAVMYYKCSEGLAPMSYQLAKCTANGTWLYTACSEPEFHCSEAPEVSHASHNVSKLRQQHGTVVQYQCAAGYRMEGTATITCQKTAWSGTLPTCMQSYTNQPDDVSRDQSLINHRVYVTAGCAAAAVSVLPIVAGVVTAVLLTAILILTGLCLRNRYVKCQQANAVRSVLSSSATSTPTPLRHTPPSGAPPPLPVYQQQRSGIATSSPLTPYHSLQCPHNHNPASSTDYSHTSSIQNYGTDSSLRLSADSGGHSSSPSTVQSELSITDSEFHTIRECIGESRNSSLVTTSASAPPAHFAPLSHHYRLRGSQNSLQQQHHHSAARLHHQTFNAITTPRTRTLWTQDGRPYEAVTCEHGVEHIYQPLEHIYEEPHIWTRPLPSS